MEVIDPKIARVVRELIDLEMVLPDGAELTQDDFAGDGSLMLQVPAAVGLDVVYLGMLVRVGNVDQFGDPKGLVRLRLLLDVNEYKDVVVECLKVGCRDISVRRHA